MSTDRTFFNPVQLRQDIGLVKQLLANTESVDTFVSTVFESDRDQAIEFYEFLDLLLILRSQPHPLDMTTLRTIIGTARLHPIERPWEFDENGKCSMPAAYAAAHSLFLSMDADHNGILSKQELYGFELPKK